MLKIIEKLCKTGTSPRSGRKLNFRGITWHETGNTSPTATAKSHADYVFNLKEEKSWHYCIDKDEAWRSIPENEVAWCNGDGKTSNGGNMTTLSLEICINNGGDFERAKDNACWLTADILKRNGMKKAIRKENIFIHHDWSGKDCPHNIRKTSGELDRMIAVTNVYLNEMWGITTTPSSPPVPQTTKDKFNIGDIVNFSGGYHYSSSQEDKPSGGVRTAGKAKVTTVASGKKHPYHLVGASGGSNVYGWVDASTIGSASTPQESKPTTFKKGDKVKVKSGSKWYNGNAVPSWVIGDVWIVYDNQVGDKVVINSNVKGSNKIMSPIKAENLIKA